VSWLNDFFSRLSLETKPRSKSWPAIDCLTSALDVATFLRHSAVKLDASETWISFVENGCSITFSIAVGYVYKSGMLFAT